MDKNMKDKKILDLLIGKLQQEMVRYFHREGGGFGGGYVRSGYIRGIEFSIDNMNKTFNTDYESSVYTLKDVLTSYGKRKTIIKK